MWCALVLWCVTRCICLEDCVTRRQKLWPVDGLARNFFTCTLTALTLLQDIADQKDRISGLQSDISELEAAEEDIRAHLEKSTDSGLKLGASDIKQYSALREQVSSQIARENVIKSNIELDLKSKHELIKRLTAQMESTAAEGVSGDAMIEQCEARYKQLSGAVSSCTAEQKALLAAREALGEY